MDARTHIHTYMYKKTRPLLAVCTTKISLNHRRRAILRTLVTHVKLRYSALQLAKFLETQSPQQPKQWTTSLYLFQFSYQKPLFTPVPSIFLMQKVTLIPNSDCAIVYCLYLLPVSSIWPDNALPAMQTSKKVSLNWFFMAIADPALWYNVIHGCHVHVHVL